MSETLASTDGPEFAPDFERRFGGLRRLFGVQGAQRIFDAHVVVVGIGGVGSWAAEALARSGVRRLSLIDLDHVAESNLNRQIHALGSTIGKSKVQAMRERIADIHPGCQVDAVEAFVDADNFSDLLQALQGGAPTPVRPDGLIDACDQVRAKTALAAWAAGARVPCVVVGAAGGKRQVTALEVGDLAEVTHDPLLAQLRYRLRKHHQGARQGRMGVRCVFSREPVAPPDPSCDLSGPSDGSLNCHGFGSVVSVTATFGMAAAGECMRCLSEAKNLGRL